MSKAPFNQPNVFTSPAALYTLAAFCCGVLVIIVLIMFCCFILQYCERFCGAKWLHKNILITQEQQNVASPLKCGHQSDDVVVDI